MESNIQPLLIRYLQYYVDINSTTIVTLRYWPPTARFSSELNYSMHEPIEQPISVLMEGLLDSLTSTWQF